MNPIDLLALTEIRLTHPVVQGRWFPRDTYIRAFASSVIWSYIGSRR